MSDRLPSHASRPCRLAPCARILIAAVAGFLSKPAQAADQPDSSLVRKWDLSAEMKMSNLSMDIYQKDVTHKVRYKPNNPPGFEVGLSYQGVGGSIGYSTGKLKDEYDVSTHSLDLQLFWHRPRFGADLYYQTYEGYFIEGDSTHGPLLFPKLGMSTQTANVYAKLWGNVDLTTLSSPDSLRSPVSWLVYASSSVSRRKVSSSAPLVPAYEAANYPDLAGFESFEVLVPSASIGLLLALRFGGFYVAPGLGVGVGHPFDLSDRLEPMEGAAKVNLRLLTGFDDNSGGWGLHIFGDSDALKLHPNETAQLMSLRMRLFKDWKF